MEKDVFMSNKITRRLSILITDIFPVMGFAICYAKQNNCLKKEFDFQEPFSEVLS